MSTSRVAWQLCGEETVCVGRLNTAEWSWSSAAPTSAVWTEIWVWCMKHICLHSNYSNAVVWFHSFWSWLDAATFTLLFSNESSLGGRSCSIREVRGKCWRKEVLAFPCTASGTSDWGGEFKRGAGTYFLIFSKVEEDNSCELTEHETQIDEMRLRFLCQPPTALCAITSGSLHVTAFTSWALVLSQLIVQKQASVAVTTETRWSVHRDVTLQQRGKQKKTLSSPVLSVHIMFYYTGWMRHH